MWFGPGFLQGRARDVTFIASPRNSIPEERWKEQAMSSCGGMDVCLGEGWSVSVRLWGCLIWGVRGVCAVYFFPI